MDQVVDLLVDPTTIVDMGKELLCAYGSNGDTVYLRVEDGKWDNSLLGPGWEKHGGYGEPEFMRGPLGLGRNVDGMLSLSYDEWEGGGPVVTLQVVGV